MNVQDRILTFVMEPHSRGSITGWSSLKKCITLADTITKNNLKYGIDLGIWGGRSTISMGFAFQQTNGKVFGIDPYDPKASTEGKYNSPENNKWWAGVDYGRVYNDFVDNVIRHNLRAHVKWVEAKSLNAVGLFEDESVDILHQDSNHSADIVEAELDAYAPKMKRGGWWFVDDWNWSELEPAHDAFKKSGFKLIGEYEDGSWAIFQKK